MTFKILVPAALLLALPGCDEDPEIAAAAEDGDLRAEGEVAGGTISDEMLQLDRVRSMTPRAEIGDTGREDEGEAVTDRSAGSAGSEPSSEPVPEPAAEPDEAETATGTEAE